MKTYVWLTFAFMGWGYYEMSGGDEFVPVQEPVIAEAEIEPSEDLVTRASTPTLLSVSTSNVSTSQPEAEASIIPAVAQATPVEDTVVETIVEVAAPIEAAPLDIRQVAGSRVNMRMGPSTDFDVITTLNAGAEMEVLEVNADGWARVSTVDRGIEGWMAERLLTAPQG